MDHATRFSRRALFRLGATVTLALALAACGSGGDGSGESAADPTAAKEHWPAYDPEPAWGDRADEALYQYAARHVRFDGRLAPYETAGDYFGTSDLDFEAAGYPFGADGVPLVRYGDELHENAVTVAQFGLSQHGKFLAGEISWAEVEPALDRLLALQGSDGAFRYDFAYPYYLAPGGYPPGWVSAMAQGQALSLFARAYRVTGDRRYLAAGDAALAFLGVPVAEGGVEGTLADLDPSLAGYRTYELYPVEPSSYTLNGFLFTLFGLYDWWQLAPDALDGPHAEAGERFRAAVPAAARVLGYYDLDGFSAYDLGHVVYGREPHLAADYHAVHVYLLHGLYGLTGEPAFERYERRWAADVGSGPASTLSLRTDVAGPVPCGTAVEVRAEAADDGLEYRFAVRSPSGSWEVARPYGPEASWVWNTGALAPGAYGLRAEARRVGSAVARDEVRVAAVDLVPPPASGAALAASPPEEQRAGLPATFEGSAAGGSGRYEYRFWLLRDGAWEVVRDYSPEPLWTWPTAGVAPGEYAVEVDVRSLGSPSYREATAVLWYRIEG